MIYVTRCFNTFNVVQISSRLGVGNLQANTFITHGSTNHNTLSVKLLTASFRRCPFHEKLNALLFMFRLHRRTRSWFPSPAADTVAGVRIHASRSFVCSSSFLHAFSRSFAILNRAAAVVGSTANPGIPKGVELSPIM